MKLFVICGLIASVSGQDFDNVDLNLLNHLPEEKLLEAFCQSFCKKTSSQVCYVNDCICKDVNLTMPVGTTPIPQLNCKEDKSAHIFWAVDGNFAYFLEYENDIYKNYSDVVTCGSYLLDSLKEDTVYQIYLWAVSFLKMQILRSGALKIETSNENLVPSPVTEVFVQKLVLKEDSYEAVIKWKPNKDYSCQYFLVWLGAETVNEESVNVISDPYEITLKNLKFETNYTGDIIAKSSDSLLESRKTSFFFVTPTCLESFFSLDKCPPEAPTNLVINETLIDINTSEQKFIYDINLKWTEPDLLPDYYVAHFGNMILDGSNVTETFLNVTGNQTSATFKSMELGVLYQISLMACSSAGCSKKIAENRHRADITAITVSAHPLWSISGLILVIVGTLITIPTVIVATVFINRYRAKQERREKRHKYFTELEEKTPGPSEKLEVDLIMGQDADEWEIDPNRLYFQNVIGEGAFGIVRRACLEAEGGKREVAIKMLKDSPTAEEVRQFTQEIEIMKTVRQHPYVVSLIGCITQRRPEGPILVVEYCSRGDLQSYLREAWEKFSNNMQRDIIYIDDSYSTSAPNYFANKTYDFPNPNLSDDYVIKPKHLLSIARQVALGMEHLAKTRVVHRDLAARNVLVCEDHTVKVSDFGLSRDVYQDNVYCKKGGGKLPIRWMALESLTHQKYTTQSDVWSYGILLWEIVTFGGTPYAGVHSSEFLDLLKNGYRLKCPLTCSYELYGIMQSCWHASPKERPTFTELAKTLERLLENVSQYLHLENIQDPLKPELIKNKSGKLEQISGTYERYVKPINTFK